MKKGFLKFLVPLTIAGFLVTGCSDKDEDEDSSDTKPDAQVTSTCSGTYPSYWQDQDSKFVDMWDGQAITNTPDSQKWDGPVFRLADAYPTQLVDDKANQAWRDARFDKLFTLGTSASDQKEKEKLAYEYGWLVLNYILEGNVNREGVEDFDVCNNKVRPWYSIPFQTYDALSGREFVHGLTREAPVSFSTPQGVIKTTMWAVGFYNATAAYTLGQVWQKNGEAKIPTEHLNFAEGAVVGKPLFNTSSPEQLPVLANQPTWAANISDTDFCSCERKDGKECSLADESITCRRSIKPVRLLQFDFAVKDSRAPETGWVFGTFVADGQRKAKEPDLWQRMALLGVMWGNDTPPAGQLASNYPADVKKNGFKEEVIYWDAVDELNRYRNKNDKEGKETIKLPGHLGCNYRLNGPADNANSSCMSCHGTASVPDKNKVTPPLLPQFAGMPYMCVTENTDTDRSGNKSPGTKYFPSAAIDALYFANTGAGESFNVTEKMGAYSLNADAPAYPDGRKEWISTDYSLQMSIALQQWMQWQDDKNAKPQERVFSTTLLRGGE